MPARPNSTLRQVPLGARLVLAGALLLGAPWLAHADVNLVRLTPEQYQQAIHDIFGPNIHVGDNKVDPGVRDEGLVALGNRKLTMGASELERDEQLAQEIAAQVVDPQRRA